VEAAEIGRYAYELHAEDDDFGQAGTLVRDVMTDTDREHLVGNIVAHASDNVSADVQRRVVEYWTNVDGDLGGRVADGLGVGRAKALA
jgi:catalase